MNYAHNVAWTVTDITTDREHTVFAKSRDAARMSVARDVADYAPGGLVAALRGLRCRRAADLDVPPPADRTARPADTERPRYHCTRCGFETNDDICKGYCFDSSGYSCSKAVCPCGAVHYWGGGSGGRRTA